MSLLEVKLMGIPGVEAVHDLHVWTITSGLDAMSCHLVVTDMAEARSILSSGPQRDGRKLRLVARYNSGGG